MNIPFYRYVRHDGDGHDIFQCLHCMSHLDTIGYEFLYCPFCGIQFQGQILRKKIDCYKSQKEDSSLLWVVESKAKWKDDTFESEWEKETFSCPTTAKEVINFMREIKLDRKNSGFLEYSFRFAKTIFLNREYYRIDTDKYFKRTGKVFPPAQ